MSTYVHGKAHTVSVILTCELDVVSMIQRRGRPTSAMPAPQEAEEGPQAQPLRARPGRGTESSSQESGSPVRSWGLTSCGEVPGDQRGQEGWGVSHPRSTS